MPKLSVSELSQLTGKTRATVTKGLDGLDSEAGAKGAKLYDSKIALAKLYGAAGESGETFITNAEAQRQLTIARQEEIKLGMEVTRKERVPLDDVEEINDRVFSNVAGILKANEGKPLTAETIGDIFTELRTVGDALKDG